VSEYENVRMNCLILTFLSLAHLLILSLSHL
jgi:hypothetical protein